MRQDRVESMIMDMMRETAAPLSSSDIAIAIGEPKKSVTSRLTGMVGKPSSEIVRVGSPRRHLYIHETHIVAMYQRPKTEEDGGIYESLCDGDSQWVDMGGWNVFTGCEGALSNMETPEKALNRHKFVTLVSSTSMLARALKELSTTAQQDVICDAIVCNVAALSGISVPP